MFVSFVKHKKWYIRLINKTLDEYLEAKISVLNEFKNNRYYCPAVDIQINVSYDKIEH